MTFVTFPANAIIVTGRVYETKLGYEKKPKGVSTYKGGLYCGPEWGYTYQDILDGKISKLPDAIDAIDEACKNHDYCYQENGYLTQGCNLVLTVDLVKVITNESSTGQQRLDAAIMAALFFIESQSVDLVVLGKEKMSRLKLDIEAMLLSGSMTLQRAIIEVLSRQGGGL